MGETPNPQRPSSPPSGNRAARYLFMALLGLVTGVVATVMLTRALHARKDHYPEAVMYVMQAHMAALKQDVAGNRCAATDTLPHFTTLRHLSNDFEPAFPGFAEDADFAGHASAMRASLDAVLASPPLNCAGVRAAQDKIGANCKACHDGYRQ